MSAPALAVQGISYAYARGRPVLEEVGLEVPAGSFTALLGPNGAGKSTLMSLVTRLFAARGGSIRIAGHDLAQAPRQALAAIGVVFQRPTLDLDLSVRQNLRYAARLYGLSGAEMDRRIEQGVGRARLKDRIDVPVRALSGGMRRRVELARALLHAPQLLVLDEPTVGLDIDSRRGIVEHVHALCAQEGLAALWATHLVDEVRPDDRLVVLHKGRVRAAGPVAEVAQDGDLTAAFARLTRDEPR